MKIILDKITQIESKVQDTFFFRALESERKPLTPIDTYFSSFRVPVRTGLLLRTVVCSFRLGRACLTYH